ncbi:GNAT family N-acetyltransferase [Pseudomonas sp. MT3]|nr:GNAT family N-acetyltransferase [uncultured Pseudomonas sp.]
MHASPLNIRDAHPDDLSTIAAIYRHYVLHSCATFEETPPTTAELEQRYAGVVASGLPYLVAECEGEVLGYCYATPFRQRPAYRFTLENSVYVRHDASGQGIGSALLRTLLARCGRGPWKQVIAVVGDSENHASRALHRRFGFREVGVLEKVGFKLGRWVDTVYLQRELNP